MTTPPTTVPTKLRVLMVDDEPNVLAGYRRSLGRRFDIITAEGGQAGLQALREQGPFSVVITDMRMPEIDGLAFLKSARASHPDSVYMMLTGNADQQTATDAINQGQIFRFLNKPSTPEQLEQAIDACARQHELILAERVLLRQTLTGSVKLLAEAITLSDPPTAQAIAAVRRDVPALCQSLGVEHDWRLALASSLCLLGNLLSPDAQAKASLSDTFLARSAEAGANLLRHIPRLEEIAQIIARQRESGNLPGAIDLSTTDGRVEFGARMLHFCVDWHRETLASQGDRLLALKRLSQHATHYDPRLLQAATQLAIKTDSPTRQNQVKRVHCQVRDITAGMVLDQNVTTADGKMLLSKGQVLTQLQAERLKAFARSSLIAPEADVLIESAEAA